MEVLFLKDNSEKKEIDESLIKPLNKIANKTINELLEKYPDLLIFQDGFNANDDSFDKDKKIFTLSDRKLSTYNLMGFIGIDELTITIGSRFDEDKKQYFLQYILSKVFSINLFNFNTAINDENIWDFLLFFLFAIYLDKVMKQGLIRKYVEVKYNKPNVKGRIDVSRHIRNNIPFLGNIAYTVREFSYNNKLTKLIRHTIEYIAASKFSKILSDNIHIITNVKKIREITNDYKRINRLKIINNNLKQISHPYFSKYEVLRKLCLKILRKKGMLYNSGKEKVSGILFDGAWLWEEYLNSLLKTIDFIHPENKKNKKPIYIFKDNKRYKRFPDFYFESKNKNMVIEAKYKRLDNQNIDRNDIHQLISYLYILKAKEGFILFPTKNGKSGIEKVGSLKGYGGNIYKYKFKVSQNVDTFEEYIEQMELEESKLIKNVKEHIYKSKV